MAASSKVRLSPRSADRNGISWRGTISVAPRISCQKASLLNDDTKSVPLIEEVAHLKKRTVETGKVTVRTVVAHEAHLVEANLSSDSVHVHRVPVDREVAIAPTVRTEGNVTIIPVFEERLVVEKRLVLVEEIHLTKLRTIEKVEVPIELRTQRAVVERTDEQS